ncbi:hypothetical protein Athai_13430 [Actinocatenispora thailandica]|uniref:Schlafen AlbA-2 domain-containing protein n=1 Tax=Actinocatenispora thailandica TaxID=227318 RepID=A0A7R7DLF6_9ACTN|nr:RNA-binding domain-containing protein [Actinocatenispora thailandica]BCJ33840.1 hypothetical protein Athai_13430 [Actinocatenispora thailandica]
MFDEPVLHVGQKSRIRRDYGFAATPDELVGMSATDLRHALAVGAPDDAGLLIVSDTPVEYITEDVVSSSGVEFEVDTAGLLMLVYVEVAEWVDDEKVLHDRLQQLLSDLLDRKRCALISAEHDLNQVGAGPYLTQLTLRPSTRAQTVDHLYRLGIEIQALVNASDGGELTRESTLNLLRAGHGAVLIGQPEGAWLDVKSQLYDITRLRGKVSMAQAVARFANSGGGVVVFGMGTKKVGSGEVVASIHPVPTDGHTVRRHRQALEAHVYPLPTGLDVEIVPADGGTLLVVHVPPQLDTVKPFLVHGAIVDDRVEGAFISIVRRHGEDTIPTTAPAVHAAMSINRVLDRLEGQLDRPMRQ